MVFTKDSQMVKSYVMLIRTGNKTMADVPDLYNLREVVEAAVAEAIANDEDIFKAL